MLSRLPKLVLWTACVFLALASLFIASSWITPPAWGNSKGDTSHSAMVLSVRLFNEETGPAVEIVMSQPVVPQIEKVEAPPRLVIDLPYSTVAKRKRITYTGQELSGVRVDQYKVDPPVVRVVVDLLTAVTYSLDSQGNHFVVHMQTEHAPATAPAFTKGVEPAVVPVAPGNSGTVMEAGTQLEGGSSISAGAETAILHLKRGGEVHVCPGTTISVTSSQGGGQLMLGMSTGALEAHYSLNASADSVLTPDFRVLMTGPGDFNYAMSVNARGDTCVRSLPGNTASMIVSELIGDGTYQIKPNEQVVFQSGKLSDRSSEVPINCGCPPPQPQVMRAENTPPAKVLPHNTQPAAVSLAQNENQAKPVDPAKGASAAPSADQNEQATAAMGSNGTSLTAPTPANAQGVNVEVEAPLVFRAPQPPPAPVKETAQIAPDNSQQHPTLPTTMVVPPAPKEEPKQENRGFFGKIGHFFKSIFH